MKIVEIGYHCCIRLVKQALALIPNHEVHCIGFEKPSCQEEFKTFVHCYTKSQLRNAVRLHKDADVFHIHNEPNWMVQVVREVSDKPIVLDMHDSMAYRSDKLSHIRAPMEELAYHMADGIVFVSDPCREITQEIHGIKPCTVLYPHVNERFYTSTECSWAGGIVYEGLVSTDKSREVMNYADYKSFGEACKEAGIAFHIHTPKQDEYMTEYYKDSLLEPALRYDELIKTMPQYDWGLVGNITEHKDWQVAMPNKLFEYIASGIPIISMNAKLAGEFIEEHGFGIAVKSIQEIKDRWDERMKCKMNIVKKRHDFTMEKKIHKVEELYEQIT